MMRLFLRNPVVMKELRGRMRGSRAFVVLTGFLALVGGFVLLLYMGQLSVSATTTNQIDGGAIGRTLFESVVVIELLLVAFIVPAFTAGAISGERERQTYDLLRTTLLPEGQFVMGKLFSALAYIFLLLLSAIPLQSLSFVLGGTDFPDMVVSIVILFVTSIFIGSIGIYFSAATRRTLPASIATYGVAFGVVVVTILLLGIVSEVSNLFDANSVGGEWFFLLLQGVFICLNPLATLWFTREYLVSQQSLMSFTYTFGDGSTVDLPSPWLVFTLLYVLIAVLFFWLTTRRVKQVDEF